MHFYQSLAAGAAYFTIIHAVSLADTCTVSRVLASLPANGTFLGISLDSTSITANAVYNASNTAQPFFPAATYDYCNVTLSYSHNARGDVVNLQYWFPTPDNFKNRYLSTGGGGYAINSGSQGFPGGVMYGAVAGSTDGGFGSFKTKLDAVVLKANGTLNWDAIFMFGYQAIGELTQIGKGITRNFYSIGEDDKLYTYYQACSEGGREGMSQIQRYGEEYDGVIPGAPALRYAQQQVQHLYSNVVEKTLDYFPSSCEFQRIVNATIKFCDPLDGKTDGVVARTDLCKLQFNINSTIGLPYSCAASSAAGLGFNFSSKSKRQMMPGGGASTPAANGTVSAQAVAVASTIMSGLHTSDGQFAYFSYQPSSSFEDAKTTYNNETDSYELSIASTGGEFVTKFIQMVDADNLASLDNVTYDTLVEWMREAWIKYEDTLQTTLPDLTPFYNNGGKVLTFHGESDNSIPAASSVHYHESVRSIMYPNSTFNASTEAMGEWYRLFLVPGAGHCGVNSMQPNGPFPTTNLEVLIEWVENGVKPETLRATHTAGDEKGQSAEICAWPLRPYWVNNGTNMECVYDQASVDSWMFEFDAWKMPLY
ncbi:feruloyl esteras-like protein B precursor [Ophiobolus disseminans]|uniref:Carboxylic ester hydrolase n=1 Tax=Ophiobolus disseminans TaxID=1469910 RepID=A0A6A7AJI6_9PLEO|nr:feruloyl esteras-like protein B precursor [Ophiobolus disseminans]